MGRGVVPVARDAVVHLHALLGEVFHRHERRDALEQLVLQALGVVLLGRVTALGVDLAGVLRLKRTVLGGHLIVHLVDAGPGDGLLLHERHDLGRVLRDRHLVLDTHVLGGFGLVQRVRHVLDETVLGAAPFPLLRLRDVREKGAELLRTQLGEVVLQLSRVADDLVHLLLAEDGLDAHEREVDEAGTIPHVLDVGRVDARVGRLHRLVVAPGLREDLAVLEALLEGARGLEVPDGLPTLGMDFESLDDLLAPRDAGQEVEVQHLAVAAVVGGLFHDGRGGHGRPVVLLAGLDPQRRGDVLLGPLDRLVQTPLVLGHQRVVALAALVVRERRGDGRRGTHVLLPGHPALGEGPAARVGTGQDDEDPLGLLDAVPPIVVVDDLVQEGLEELVGHDDRSYAIEMGLIAHVKEKWAFTPTIPS